jgi:hypothetical protein
LGLSGGLPYDWQDFPRANNLVSRMRKRGNCHDDALADSFFQLYNPKRKHRHANYLSL